MEHGLLFLPVGMISVKQYIISKIRIIYSRAHTDLSQIYISLGSVHRVPIYPSNSA